MDEQTMKALSELFDNKLKPIIDSQVRMEKKLDSVKKQTAELTEFRTETKENLSRININ